NPINQTTSVINNDNGSSAQNPLQALLALLNNSSLVDSQNKQSFYLDKNGQVQDPSSGLVEMEEEGEDVEGNKKGFEEWRDYDNDKLTRSDKDKNIQCDGKKEEGQEVGPVDRFKAEEYKPISDLFDYYYKIEVQVVEEYRTGDLEEMQLCQLQSLLNEHQDVCAQSFNELGRSNVIRHQILTQDVWPI
ncbi:41598_t:CDS:2, partial [Gigaspora margarita]